MKNYSYSKYSKDLVNKTNLISLISKRNALNEFDLDEYITIQNKLKSPEVSSINDLFILYIFLDNL